MDKDLNYVGFIVFWLYNITALVLTFVVIRTILSLPQTTFNKDTVKRTKEIKKFSVLAAISFATLSYNMLNVLFQSFGQWSAKQSTQHSIGFVQFALNIRQWSLESSLFHDFGMAILNDNARVFWTQAALLMTLFISFDIGVVGRQTQMPRLWAIFELMQILPVSFAQNLFYVALLRRSPNRQASSPVTLPRHPTIVVIAVYTACLLVVPYMVRTSRLMGIILLARLMLLAPYLLPQRDSSGVKSEEVLETSSLGMPSFAQKTIIAMSSVIMIKQTISLINSGTTWTTLLQALSSHPAVSALSWDFLFSILSMVLWIQSQKSMGYLDKSDVKAP